MITIATWQYYGLCVLAAVGGIAILSCTALLVLGAVAFSGSDKVGRCHGNSDP